MFAKIKNAIKRNKSKLVLSATLALAMVTTSLSCFAAEFTAETVATAIEGGLSIFTSTIGVIVDNPLLLFILGAGLVPLGFKIFKSAKKAVK